MSPLPLRVELDGTTGNNARVWLDGNEISRGLTGFDLSVNVGESNRATFRMLVGGVNVGVDAQALAAMQTRAVSSHAEPMADDEPDLRTFGEGPAHA